MQLRFCCRLWVRPLLHSQFLLERQPAADGLFCDATTLLCRAHCKPTGRSGSKVMLHCNILAW